MLKASLQYTNPLIDYDILLMQNNGRDLPDTSSISTNQQAIKDNDEQIQFNQQNDMSQHIRLNNNDLPVSEKVPFISRAYQNSCISGYICLVQLSWQQPFVSGWQHITTEPLSATWFFWLLLLMALSGLFLLLPLNLSPRWIISYQIVYTGPFSNLNDPSFPEQKRQEMRAETSLVKIEVRSSFVLNKQKNQGDRLFPRFYYSSLVSRFFWVGFIDCWAGSKGCGVNHHKDNYQAAKSGRSWSACAIG